MNKKLKSVSVSVRKLWFYFQIGYGAIQDLILYVTPRWFKLLEWLFILGALHFIGVKTGSISIRVLYEVSTLMMFFYLLRYFYKNPIHHIFRIISIILSLGLTLLIYFFLGETIQLIELLSK